ncbi:hypothetical protein [Agathobaculum butyriciproducens]|uniref:hypothetical protein n=6 Tax=Agathobaculum butyriciproducens TaxID=1628085 RepID=UPI00210CC560|nr:hypothetical protein [Agathobaculum butyriciproducens]
MTESERNWYRSHNPNLNKDNREHLDEQNRVINLLNPQFDCTDLPQPKADELYNARENFHHLANGYDEPLYSKLRFADWLCQQGQCSEELLLRFLTDRSFYFADQRDLGNYPGDSHGIKPDVGLDTLLLDDNVWSDVQHAANITDAELLQRGLEDIKATHGDLELGKKIYDGLFDLSQKISLSTEEIEKFLHNSHYSRDFPEPGYYFIAAFENAHRAQLICEHEWIPTTVHQYFLEENERRYSELNKQIRRQQDSFLCSKHLIDELNKISSDCPQFPQECSDSEFLSKLKTTIALFEQYVRSTLYAVRNRTYEGILYTVKRPLEQRPYYAAIYRLLNACYQDKRWHRLTPLFLYHAFSGSTKVILRCATEKHRRKLIKRISQQNEPARVKRMTTMTGRRAAINLVLYAKLKNTFNSSTSVCLLNRSPKTCARLPYAADENIYRRIKFPVGKSNPQCPTDCPFRRDAKEYLDWGFALTTKYGLLQHHLNGIDDSVQIPESELLCKRDLLEDDEDNEAQSADSTNEPKVSIWRYATDYRKPVGTLEGLLRNHIMNCFPNRPYNLTPTTPNTYRSKDSNPFDAPYAELAGLLLQEQHLPAMLRIIRQIKKLLSMHSEYVDGYRRFLEYPAPTSMVIDYLQGIIQRHNIMWQVVRFPEFEKSRASYNIRDSIQNILEYEIRARIYDGMYNELEQLAYRSLSKIPFLYNKTTETSVKPLARKLH